MMQDQPIPGENFTSDTRSYPWHQPPEFTAIGPALEKMSQKMTDKKTAPLLMSMVETGLPLYKVTQIIVMEGLAGGKWTLDLGLLLAGPLTKILEILCNIYEVEYDLGIEDNDDIPTGKFTRGLIDMENSTSDRGVLKLVRDEMPKIEEAAEGQGTPEAPEGDAGTTPPEQGEPDLAQEGFTTMMGGGAKEDEEENVGDSK